MVIDMDLTLTCGCSGLTPSPAVVSQPVDTLDPTTQSLATLDPTTQAIATLDPTSQPVTTVDLTPQPVGIVAGAPIAMVMSPPSPSPDDDDVQREALDSGPGSLSAALSTAITVGVGLAATLVVLTEF